MEDNKFEIFKEVFGEIAKSHFNACESFMNNLKECEDNSDIAQLMYRYSDDIAEKLDAYSDDVNELERKIDELERKIDDLEDELSDLEAQLLEAKEPFGETLHDDMKLTLFLQHVHKFTPWELEEILTK